MNEYTNPIKGEDPMTKIDVRVPQLLLNEIDEKYGKRGYTSRSEAIRDALRSWVDPPSVSPRRSWKTSLPVLSR